MVLWSRLHASNAGDVGKIPDQGTQILLMRVKEESEKAVLASASPVLTPETESGCRSVVPLGGRGPSGAEKGDPWPAPRAPTP